MISVVALDRAPPQPWRNGGGVTRELLAWPSAGDWRVRISVADITRDGPFSPYPGVERWFAVLEGAGVTLDFATRRVTLAPDSLPLQFDGADAPMASLPGGATRDLNLMLRRDVAQGGMRRAAAGEDWRSDAPLRALFVTGPARLQVDGADAARLPGGSLAWSAGAAGQRWRLLADDEPPRAFWLWCGPRA